MKSLKKLIVLLIVLGISISSYAGLKSKHIIGEWKYVITLYTGQTTGTLKFFQIKSELLGEAIDSEGNKSTISKIKINKKNNTLSFEIQRETDIPIEFILIVEDKKFRGKGWINDSNFEITGEKIN